MTLISQLPALELMSKQSLSNTWKASLLSRWQSAPWHTEAQSSPAALWAGLFQTAEPPAHSAHASWPWRDASQDARLQQDSGRRRRNGEHCFVPSQLRACVPDDSNLLPLCSHPGKTATASQVLILWLQINFSKSLKNLLGVKDIEGRSRGAQENLWPEGGRKKGTFKLNERGQSCKKTEFSVYVIISKVCCTFIIEKNSASPECQADCCVPCEAQTFPFTSLLLIASGISSNQKYRPLRGKNALFFSLS